MTISIQLTTRCNLNCSQCFVDPSGCDLPLEHLKKVIAFAEEFNCSHLAFTGGEPTLHPELPEVMELLKKNGFTFSFVTNGWNFPSFCQTLRSYLPKVKIISFSLDGATEAVHDRNRGKGSHRRVLEAIGTCRSKAIPFGLKTTVTKLNLPELEEVAALAAKAGAEFLGVSPLMPTPRAEELELLLEPKDFQKITEEVSLLRKRYKTNIFLTTGYFDRESLVLCPPLTMRQLYITARGDLSFCCQLADYRGGDNDSDLLGNLERVSLSELLERMVDAVAGFMKSKIRCFSEGRFGELDHYPCWYCLKWFRKVEWMADLTGNRWSDDLRRQGVLDGDGRKEAGHRDFAGMQKGF